MSTHLPAPAAPRASLGPSDFGDLLTTRTDSLFQRIQMAVLALVCAFPAYMFLMVAVWPTPASTPPSGAFGIPGRIVCFILGALLAWGAKSAASGVLSVYRFYEHGVTRSVLGRVRQSIQYSHAETLEYSLTRHYTNGIYTGTAVKMEIRAHPAAPGAKAKRLTFNTRHREKPGGLLSRTFIQKNFTGEDELDAIKNIISAAMVQTWLSRPDFKAKWGPFGFLTPKGLELVLRNGPAGLFPYSALGAPHTQDSNILVPIEGAPIKTMYFNLNYTNLWPGLLLVGMMKQAAGGESGPEAPPPTS